MYADTDPPIYVLEIAKHFDQLSLNERLYAHYMSHASYHGYRVVLRQVSPESEHIFDLIIELHKACDGDWMSLAYRTCVPTKRVNEFLEYAATFLDSLDNYKGYGDQKFVPRLPVNEFSKLRSSTIKTKCLFDQVVEAIHSDLPSTLGYPDDGGMSAYYPESPNITKKDIKAVDDFILSQGFHLQNTRLKFIAPDRYEVLVASAENLVPSDSFEGTNFQLSNSNRQIAFAFGDHHTETDSVARCLGQAAKFSRNEFQKTYLEYLTKYFRNGSIAAHKKASVAWVQDKSPPVETVIEFMESYRDPSNIRCEWEAIVAIQNKELTKAFSCLADHAEDLIRTLPWNGIAGEVEPGQIGAFESLTGPNYRDIKAKHGRKNVSFANRLSAVHLSNVILFVKTADIASYKAHRQLCFDMIVAAHELIGHGSGKMLCETEKGQQHNFDIERPPLNPLTQQPIKTWYKFGETPKSVFSSIATSYNECLAESIALYLISNEMLLNAMGAVGPGKGSSRAEGQSVPKLFNHHDALVLHAHLLDLISVIYNCYMEIIILGLNGLLIYNPAEKKWGQAHDRARFSMLKCMAETDDGSFLKIETHQDSASSADDENETAISNLTIHLTEHLVETVGRKATERLILHLHIYPCTTDVIAGTKFYEDLTAVNELQL